MTETHTPIKTTWPIVIAGAGPVGLACALMLRHAGIEADQILLLDAKTQAQAEQDARSIALSYGSAQLLNQIYAAPQKSTAIQEIHVSRRGHFGRSMMLASDYHVPALGYVARYGDIITPLETQRHAQQLCCLRPVRVSAMEETPEQVSIQLQNADGGTQQLQAKILIQAEGGTFSDQTQGHQYHDYQQCAIIAEVQVDRAIPHRAFERFTDQGPLALLPLVSRESGVPGYALVWCLRTDQAPAVMQLDDAAFLSALQQAFGDRLGRFVSSSERHAFPLGLNVQSQRALEPTQQRCVRIGNAAQTLHPVAGQGLNLGLRDAHDLAYRLSREISPKAIGQFLAQRKTDRRITIGLTHNLASLFTLGTLSSPVQDGSFLQTLLGLQLSALDLIPPAKGFLAKQMMFGWR